MQGEKANFSGGVVNKPSNKGFLFSHLSENKQLNAEIPIGQEGGPHFHPGGNMDMPKVWTKRNKRARGMDIKGKDTRNLVKLGQPIQQPAKPNQNKQHSLQVCRDNMGRVVELSNPVIIPTNQTQQQHKEAVVFLA
jgi:hypothetical protein